MLLLCAAACIYFRHDLADTRSYQQKELEKRRQKVLETSDAMFSAFRDNIMAFAREFSDVSADSEKIWNEAASVICGELERVRSGIYDWTLKRSGWAFVLNPVWKDGMSPREMRDMPDEKWWQNIDLIEKTRVDGAIKSDSVDKLTVPALESLALRGYAPAIEQLSLHCHNGTIVPQDRVLAMLWAETGCHVTAQAGILGIPGKYHFPESEAPSDGNDSYLKYLLGVCCYEGNDLVEKDERMGLEILQKAADDGSVNAENWLAENLRK